jgi:putative ABC transport system substrate-binding protein
MRRREFISLIGGVAATWPLAVQAKQPVLPVVGLLRTTEPAEHVAEFRRGLSDSGYTDGANVTLDIRVAEGKQDRLSDLAADLVRKRVAVIVTNTNATPYAISATKSIPIVFVTGRDPVAAGFVPNLNHPGGNVTGVSFFNEALTSKRLEILHELVPKAETVALLVDPGQLRAEADLRELDKGGQALGQKVLVFKASNDREIDARHGVMHRTGPVPGAKRTSPFCGNPLSRSLLGVKRTSLFAAHMSANDPKRTL